MGQRGDEPKMIVNRTQEVITEFSEGLKGESGCRQTIATKEGRGCHHSDDLNSL